MIEVFRTNVESPGEATILTAKLAETLPGSRISFDLEDCDRILRVEAVSVQPEVIRRLLGTAGYLCERLE